MSTSEVQFDGLVGPTHNYAGLATGNLASAKHKGLLSHPKKAALQGLEKMWKVRSLGVDQAVLLPHERPHLGWLRRWGFDGSDGEVIAKAAASEPFLLRIASSASAMWTANAATVAPSADTLDGRVHFLAANLSAQPHRGLEAEFTARTLATIFSDPKHFCVHEPLPGGRVLGDEGAANHTRMYGSSGALHIFAWGREALEAGAARQTRMASQAAARLLCLKTPGVFPKQAPHGIERGSFHTDVLAVGTGHTLLAHEFAFADIRALENEIANYVGPEAQVWVAKEKELPVDEAVGAYPFNSQLLAVSGGLELIAPGECEQSPGVQRYFGRLLSEGVLQAVHYVDVRESMQNGGGPACLRLRVTLTEEERASLGGRVLLDEFLYQALKEWISKHYRDELRVEDLADPNLASEVQSALDEFSQIVEMPNLYDFQRTS